jgi:hypothetical protein
MELVVSAIPPIELSQDALLCVPASGVTRSGLYTLGPMSLCRLLRDGFIPTAAQSSPGPPCRYRWCLKASYTVISHTLCCFGSHCFPVHPQSLFRGSILIASICLRPFVEFAHHDLYWLFSRPFIQQRINVIQLIP